MEAAAIVHRKKTEHHTRNIHNVAIKQLAEARRAREQTPCDYYAECRIGLTGRYCGVKLALAVYDCTP